MFENLTDKLSKALGSFKNKGKLTESDIKSGMREIKLALLEADVNYLVVKELVSKISEKALGKEVLDSILPEQQIVKIVNDELVSIMGSDSYSIKLSSNPPTIVLLCGLQGSGKTTASAKLANMFKSNGKRSLLVACDTYRPAAIEQLKINAKRIDVPVFELGTDVSPVEIAKSSIKFAKKNAYDIIFIDTAGRLQIDSDLMQELGEIKSEVKPDEILLVVDSMSGQESLNVSKTFDEYLDITGVILTKLDGDSRGGAALSIKYITGKPIKYVSSGEKLDTIEQFHPDRMASRILGMGDVLSLVEKAEKTIDEKKALQLSKKLKESSFTLNDYLDQLNQLKSMGSLQSVLGMMPGISNKVDLSNVDENVLSKTEAIILSMTNDEREKPSILNGSRRKRIALGSGTKIEDVNKLIKQYDQMNKIFKQFSNKGNNKKLNKKLMKKYGL